jgi:hypothetical protein
MTDDPSFGDLKTCHHGNPAHALVSASFGATEASHAQGECENARVWTVSNTPRYGTAKNGSEVPIKRGVSPYRPMDKRYDRYGSSRGRPKGLSPLRFDLQPIRLGQPIRCREYAPAPSR